MRISTGAFLRLVLPTEGYYCAVVFRTYEEKPRQFFTPSLDELEQRLLTEDANGHTVYHACASFKVPGRRTGDNARYAKSLWLDLDVGPGKAYPAIELATEAVTEFTRRCKFPADCFVQSGYGAHVYWCFDKNIDAPKWRHMAQSFRMHCEQKGLLADHARTADIASILRPVGSTNRKNGEQREVRGYVP